MFLQTTHSIFSGNNLSPKTPDTIAIERIVEYNVPVFMLLFVCCAIAIYVYLAHYKKTIQMFGVVIQYSTLQQARRDGHTFFRSFSVFLFLMYMICAGIFFSDFIRYEGWLRSFSQNTILVLSIIFIGIVILFRIGLSSTLGVFLKENNAAEDGIIQYSFSIYVGSFVMLICCLLLHYSRLPQPYLFSLGVLLFGLLYSLRMLKILVFGYSVYGFSLFHLILYLCAVEILPFAIFIKLLMNS